MTILVIAVAYFIGLVMGFIACAILCKEKVTDYREEMAKHHANEDGRQYIPTK